MQQTCYISKLSSENPDRWCNSSSSNKCNGCTTSELWKQARWRACCKSHKEKANLCKAEAEMGRTNVGYPVQMPTSQQEWAFSSSECRSISTAALQRARSVIHALSQTDNCDARPPPQEQKVPAYNGAQSCRYPPPNKSKPHYHTTYPEPSSKSLMHGIMVKLVGSMNKKIFHFRSSLVTCQLTIVMLKAENPELFKDIIPILGEFHFISMLSMKDSESLAWPTLW